MGTPITSLITSKEISIQDLKGKTLAVDAFNMLYQFLSTIRQRDGSLLTDSKGQVTSHLTGLFSRVTKLMLEGVKLAFVFDGIVPDLKTKERERRKKLKIEAKDKYEEAKQAEDIESMNKYASRTSVLTTEMIVEAKKLLKALGIVVVNAPSEGEAQASYMVEKGDCYAIVSQDADALLFKASRIIKNLTISGKRKATNQLTYRTINPEIINLAETLNNLGITQEQLIIIALLSGTDYNIGGVKGIGPKKALGLVKLHGNNYDEIFEEVEWDKYFDIPWTEVFYTIKHMKTTDDYLLEWQTPDKDAVVDLLVHKHDFGLERIESTMNKLLKGRPDKTQKGLGDFF
ncbi:MAG: flap endonuclease-1 [Nanoarchaeota archaeon]|nr:flap endonuclease-1 [Nanoarchaeota archaeon]MBU1030006.1 flap endonuclease-1 [Nanoarchaeota archaeon]MBU1850192.1 flap endonuclease-1 [Nanoarchaeota archaeon]